MQSFFSLCTNSAKLAEPTTVASAKPTDAELQGTNGQEQQINDIFLTSKLSADLIDAPHEANFALQKDKYAIRVEGPALGRDAVASLLRASDDVDSRLSCIFCKLANCRFANSIGAANEYCYKTGLQGRSDTVVGRSYEFVRDHLGWIYDTKMDLQCQGENRFCYAWDILNKKTKLRLEKCHDE